MKSKNGLIFDPPIEQFAQDRAGAQLTVLSGNNNSGKSLTLKWLKYRLGRSAYMVGTSRFYHVPHLNQGVRDSSYLDQIENNFRTQFDQQNINHEQNHYDFNHIIVGLTDVQRTKLFDICGKLLGNTFQIKKVDELSDLSQRYIDMDGQNLAVGSTGTRLLMTILGICMDERISTILIDEPELGLSPRIQQELANFFSDPDARAQVFPHLSSIYLATHSHLMLSRRDISSNFIVSKEGNSISIQSVKNIGDFHRLQFNLLGNSLESIYFPSAIVVVEGKTDHAYLDRVIQLNFPGRRIAVVHSGGDVKAKVHSLRETLGDLEISPLRSRLFVVLDLIHQPGLSAELVKLGVIKDNVVTWSRNGIEYVYPPKLLADVFCCAEANLSNLSMEGDRLTLHEITKTKMKLAEQIVSAMSEQTIYPVELIEKLINPLSKAIR